MQTRNFIIVAAIPLLICGCSSLRKDVPSIHETLLEKTPPGSQYQTVWQYAERKGWQPSSQKPERGIFLRVLAHCESGAVIGGGTYWTNSGGNWRQVSPDELTMGTRWIRARLGRYWHHAGWYTKGISCYYVVDAYWCFDADDKLIDILVSKEPEMSDAEKREELDFWSGDLLNK